MKFQPSPAKIGAFFVGAVVLVIALVIYLGSLRLFSREQVFILYFDESVNGLNIGAPVKFNGVPIGRVSDIRVRYNQQPDSNAIPVFIKIDLERISKSVGTFIESADERKFRAQVEQGLRGKLELMSFISGQLFVDLYYSQEALAKGTAPDYEQVEPLHLEIPTEPSSLAALGANATDVLARLSAFDTKAISDELVGLLRNLNRKVGDFDAQGVSKSFTGAAQSVERTLDSPEFRQTLTNLNKTLTRYEALAARIDAQVDPTAESLQGSTRQLQATLAELQTTARTLNTLLAPDSELRHDLNGTLRELNDTARALREFSEQLDRNPRALIFGRTPQP